MCLTCWSDCIVWWEPRGYGGNNVSVLFPRYITKLQILKKSNRMLLMNRRNYLVCRNYILNYVILVI